jgi:hypothetical protein
MAFIAPFWFLCLLDNSEAAGDAIGKHSYDVVTFSKDRIDVIKFVFSNFFFKKKV